MEADIILFVKNDFDLSRFLLHFNILKDIAFVFFPFAQSMIGVRCVNETARRCV